jgi:predicted nuclease of predicted toxin-antitoxin system
VRILLDEQLPRQLARYLVGHEVPTVQREGWAGLTNGELLQRAAQADFQVCVTGDQNLLFQQNLARSSVRVLVLAARSNVLEDLVPLIARLLEAIPLSQPGQVVRVANR